jgi:beta-N-acetylhexosaminidase
VVNPVRGDAVLSLPSWRASAAGELAFERQPRGAFQRDTYVSVLVMEGWRRGGGAALGAVVLTSALSAGLGAASPVASSTSMSCTVAGVVGTWPVRRVAAQMVVVPVNENHVGAVATEVASGVGGVILFGSSAPSDLGTDLARLLSRAPGGIAPVVMTDEEGGKVQRMANLVGWMPSARKMARTMTTAQVYVLARRVGGRMAENRVTMNLAPVLDLDDRPGPSATNPDGTRSYSIHPAIAGAYGLAFARGMGEAGVVPVVKHFPGLGYATTNPDYGPAWTLPWSELQQQGLRPFRAGVDAGMRAVMVTTARVPGLSRLPAMLSWRVVHRELRGRLGFHGLVMTDTLSGGAVSGAGYTVRRAAVRALSVGSDLVLFNAAPQDVAVITDRIIHGIVRAVANGDLRLQRLRAAAVHVLEAKHAQVCG